MSFVLNNYQQISLFDSLGFLSERKQKILDKSWAKPFSEHIFSNIDEMMFAPLYSDKKNSRPNAPVNVIVGALILKELNGLTDDELLEECECDFRYQYALHTTSYENQPLSDRTFSRFRERNAAYELVTGRDLIHDCIVSLAENIRKYMDIAPIIKRMDSMMIESNIRQMGRLELLYTCLANLVREIARDGQTELLEGLNDYEDPNNRNRVVYHDQSTPQNEKIQKVINDAVSLLPKCKDEYGQTDDYQLLQRAIDEQTKNDGKGNRIPKAKEDGMTPDILQNPSDPDATYRSKAGKPHKGYSANLVEAVDEKGSVIVDYQYDVNTRSDASFIKEYLENAEVSEETSALITDGAYASEETSKLAADKNIYLLTTGLLGRKPKEILGQFDLDETGHKITSCPAGNVPKSGSYIKQTDSIRVSFYKHQCEGCPYQSKCNPNIKERTASLFIPLKSRRRILESTELMNDEIRTFIGRIRNGVETVPSILRNKYTVDKMPVRGKLKTKQFFGFKVAALNFSKLIRFTKGKLTCRSFELA